MAWSENRFIAQIFYNFPPKYELEYKGSRGHDELEKKKSDRPTEAFAPSPMRRSGRRRLPPRGSSSIQRSIRSPAAAAPLPAQGG